MTALVDWMRRLISQRDPGGSKASVKVRRVHREVVKVTYQDAAQTLAFDGELVGPR